MTRVATDCHVSHCVTLKVHVSYSAPCHGAQSRTSYHVGPLAPTEKCYYGVIRYVIEIIEIGPSSSTDKHGLKLCDHPSPAHVMTMH